jgi:hypothetical protein
VSLTKYDQRQEGGEGKRKKWIASHCVQLANTVKDGLNEAKNINRSLSALADVLQALDHKRNNPAQHVPYRNSRLTHMLKVLSLVFSFSLCVYIYTHTHSLSLSLPPSIYGRSYRMP